LGFNSPIFSPSIDLFGDGFESPGDFVVGLTLFVEAARRDTRSSNHRRARAVAFRMVESILGAEPEPPPMTSRISIRAVSLVAVFDA